MGRKNKSKNNKRVSSEEPPATSPPLLKRAKIADMSPAQAERAPKSSPQQGTNQQRQPREPPPEPPPSVPASQALLPPEADDLKLRNNYDIHTISVAAPSKIESKVRQVLAILRLQVDGTKNSEADAGRRKAAVVALTARAPAGNKCISVAEIAKRELKGRCWQYTGCWTRLETLNTAAKGQRPAKNADNAGEAEDADGEDDEGPAFEDVPERKLVRNTVCLVIYLAVEPVGRLKELYYEQIADSTKS